MYLATMDEEARDLLQLAAEMMHAALEARARRVDPDGIISNSVQMSRIKLEGVMNDLERPQMSEWKDFTDDEKAQIQALARAISRDDQSDKHALLWPLFRAYVLRRSEAVKDDRAEKK